jgi:hypothetical protein
VEAYAAKELCGGMNADIEMKFSEFFNTVNETTNIPANAET